MRASETGSRDVIVELFASVAILRKEAAELARDADRLHKRNGRMHTVAERLHKKIDQTHRRIRTYRSLNRIPKSLAHGNPDSKSIDAWHLRGDTRSFPDMVEAGARGAESNKQLIDMLRRSRLFRDYEGVFTKATGLPLVLRPLEFWQLAHHGKKHENPFCALLAENPATLSVCLQAHQDMIDHTGVLPHTVTCPFGLTETAVPIKLGERTIGYLRIGQVLRHMPAKSDTTRVSRQLERCGVRFTGEIRTDMGEESAFPT